MSLGCLVFEGLFENKFILICCLVITALLCCYMERKDYW